MIMPIFNMVSGGSGGYEKIISGTIVIDSNVSFGSPSTSFFVVFNKELYASIRNSLYKVNIIDNVGELTKVVDFPYNSDYSGFYPVVYKNEIHFFGGYHAPDRHEYHFSWDGEKIKILDNIPEAISYHRTSFVVFNDEIHYINTDNRIYYKYSDGKWINMDENSDLGSLDSNYDSTCFVYKGKLHMCYGNQLLRYDGGVFNSISNIPIYTGSACVFNDEIHVFSRYNYANDFSDRSHYKLVDYYSNDWKPLKNIEFPISNITIYKNFIFMNCDDYIPDIADYRKKIALYGDFYYKQ